MGSKLPAARKLWLICHEIDGFNYNVKSIYIKVNQFSVQFFNILWPLHRLTTAATEKEEEEKKKNPFIPAYDFCR